MTIQHGLPNNPTISIRCSLSTTNLRLSTFRSHQLCTFRPSQQDRICMGLCAISPPDTQPGMRLNTCTCCGTSLRRTKVFIDSSVYPEFNRPKNDASLPLTCPQSKLSKTWINPASWVGQDYTPFGIDLYLVLLLRSRTKH